MARVGIQRMKFAKIWLCITITFSLVLLSDFASSFADGGLELPKLELRDTRLDNGLRVILVPDHSAPVYAINVSYNVGSRNELPGHTGFAHLFEHMMFEGSANVGKGEHFILVLNNGGNMNGTTSEDRTIYFEELPKNQLDLGLYLEADRMRSLNVTQANLDNQRNAVEEERRQSIENQPYGRAELDLDSLSYDNFAYKHPTIGSMADLEAASVADVAAFFHTYYAPNNAVVALVGDFDPDEALAKVRKYFASIPAQPAPPKVDLREEPHYGERRESISDPLARLPRLDIAYHVPAGNTADNYAMEQLSIALAQGQSSRFYQHLVKEKQLASNVNIATDARIGASLMYIRATPRPGVSLADLEKGIDDEIAAVLKDGITSDELAKAKTQLLRRFVDRRRTVLGTAQMIGEYTVKFGDPELINTILDKESAVTLEQVNRAAKTYLLRDQRSVVTTVPSQPAPNVAREAP
jgi:predicted Zn-dependent peptidase